MLGMSDFNNRISKRWLKEVYDDAWIASKTNLVTNILNPYITLYGLI